MSEKRIKGTISQWHAQMSERCGCAIRYDEARDPIPQGTPVEIVYRDEVEIRPGQRWKDKDSDMIWDVASVASEARWAIVANHVDGTLATDDFGKGEWLSKEVLQSWLNEHATLAEGES